MSSAPRYLLFLFTLVLLASCGNGSKDGKTDDVPRDLELSTVVSDWDAFGGKDDSSGIFDFCTRFSTSGGFGVSDAAEKIRLTFDVTMPVETKVKKAEVRTLTFNCSGGSSKSYLVESIQVRPDSTGFEIDLSKGDGCDRGTELTVTGGLVVVLADLDVDPLKCSARVTAVKWLPAGETAWKACPLTTGDCGVTPDPPGGDPTI